MHFRVIEMNANTVKREHEKGVNITPGDITKDSVLQAADFENAQALILTIPKQARPGLLLSELGGSIPKSDCSACGVKT